MDIARQLKQGINTGKLVFGQRQTSSHCSKGDAKLVLVAANCPESFIHDLRNSHPSVPIHQVTMVNRQLGAACGKPFPISSLCILDEGQSELLQLAPNQ
ncbi:MAG: 50S ribosomal protein L30e [Candidatus Thermoplasmatota archaeon]|nr:50S ribosomal protein L30e [Candidatus Thermoplasmatota archaeon]